MSCLFPSNRSLAALNIFQGIFLIFVPLDSLVFAGSCRLLMINLSFVCIEASTTPILTHFTLVVILNLSNPDLLLMLKRKLLPIYHPASAPTCICGRTHNIYGNHHFRCNRIIKKAAHTSISPTMASNQSYRTRVLRGSKSLSAG